MVSGFAFKSEYFGNEGVRLITPKNFTKHGRPSFTDENTKWTTEEAPEKFLCVEGDLLLLLTDLTPTCELLGKPAVLSKEDTPCLLNQRIAKVDISNGEVERSFLANLFLTNSFVQRIKETATGSTVRHSSNKIVIGYVGSFPSLPEQRKIADFLTAVDGRIGQLVQKKAWLTDYKKGVMQQLFTQAIRFKDDHGNDFPDWEEKRVDEMFTVTRGKVLAMPETRGEPSKDYPYPVYSSQTKANGLAGYYDKYLFENAITWTTDGANAGDVKFRTGEFYCTNVCGVLLSDKGYANEFVASILGTVTRQHVSYVGNPKLMNNVMSKISISVPSSMDEQTKIADFLSAIDRKIESVATQITETQTFKRGLLQQMFV